MCGISLYCSLEKHYSSELEKSLDIMKHRGPDFTGKRTFVHKDYFIGMGHNRLSIIDLDIAANQPMTKDGNILIFNGEIYNYKNLKNKLKKEYSSKFSTNSDSEVILEIYKKFGIEGFTMLHGMFAFAIFDIDKSKLYFVRDSFGIKPLYFFKSESNFFISSEIKGIKEYLHSMQKISKEDIYEFLNMGYLNEPNTGYETIKKIKPGHFIEFDLAKKTVTEQNYYDEQNYSTDKTLEQKIANSVHDQLNADVKLGTFFSGGADSSLIANYAKETSLLFAKYDKDRSADIDNKFSRNIANYLEKDLLIADLTSENFTSEQILDNFKLTAKHCEELLADYTFWATYKLSKVARDNGFIVMLSGMGADEIFAGYPRYLITKYHFMVKLFYPLILILYKLKIYPKKHDKKIERLISYCKERYWPVAYCRLLGYLSGDDIYKLTKGKKYSKNSFNKRLENLYKDFSVKTNNKLKLSQYFDLKGFLTRNLMVSDKASMLASIELRVPLLDEDVIITGMNSRPSRLINGFETKSPLKKILKKTFPKNLIDREKSGFNPPLDSLINKLDYDTIDKNLSKIKEFVNINHVRKIVKDHYDHKSNNTYKIWQLLFLEYWLKQNT